MNKRQDGYAERRLEKWRRHNVQPKNKAEDAIEHRVVDFIFTAKIDSCPPNNLASDEDRSEQQIVKIETLFNRKAGLLEQAQKRPHTIAPIVMRLNILQPPQT